MSADCIFCKFGRGEIPLQLVYEDEMAIAFIDRCPLNPGHTLVIPRAHSETILDLEAGDYEVFMRTVRVVAKKVHAAFPSPRLSIFTKGFDVAHTHVHLIPLHGGSDIVSGKYGEHLPPEASVPEREAMAAKIRSALA